MRHVERYLTGNFTVGRGGTTVRQLIMHTIEGSVESADAVFRNPDRGASTHDGVKVGEVWLWVHMKDTAWGAGDGAVNRASHNIETEGYARDMNRSAAMLNTIADRMAEVLNHPDYEIPRLWTVGKRSGIKGHGDITPDRRWDPGGMDVGFLAWALARRGIPTDWDPGVYLKATSPLSNREAWMVHYVQRVVGTTVDGLYGNGTKAAVAQYQSRIGASADGVWGHGTWTKHMRIVKEQLDARYPLSPSPEPPPPLPPQPPSSDLEARVSVLEVQLNAAHDKIRNLQANKAGVDHPHTIT